MNIVLDISVDFKVNWDLQKNRERERFFVKKENK